jgi:peroxiredoxin
MKSITYLVLSVLLGGLIVTNAQTNATPVKKGDVIPDVAVRNEDNQEVKLRQLVAAKPTVLIFYRGGWCPYCTRHLKDLAGIESELQQAGAQIFAISMDQPAKLKETPDRDKLGYKLLSDSDAVAAQAFGIAFKVEDDLVKKYKESYKIDLEAASGREHHILPHPAVYVVDQKGKVQFSYVNPDYKIRLEPEQILAAVRLKPAK